MRFVIYGAGAVGGVIGGRLFQSGHEVLLIARGDHGRAIAGRGLRLLSPDDDLTLPIPVAARPADVTWRPDDVVVLGMKTQDTLAALDELVAAAGPAVPVICAQNGVEAERLALRRFANVYGTPVRLPATHLEPGVVEANSAPTTGILDIGRYPSGVDALCEDVCAALEKSTFSARPIPDLMRWKWTKLVVMNLSNAAQAICGGDAPLRNVVRAAKAEAVACLEAAHIEWASEEEDAARRANLITVRPIAGRIRGGGSTWQSMTRGQPIEADYLNGEIVLLGRLHGIPTPVNLGLQELANRCHRERIAPGTITVPELERQLGL